MIVGTKNRARLGRPFTAFVEQWDYDSTIIYSSLVNPPSTHQPTYPQSISSRLIADDVHAKGPHTRIVTLYCGFLDWDS
jgi:hypothetical protein